MAALVLVAFAGIWWIAAHGKGTAPGRLVAWLVAIIVLWVMVGMQDPKAAGMMASAFLAGTDQAIAGLGHFIGML